MPGFVFRSRGRSDHRSEGGQVLVIFTLAVVAIIGVVGLVLDGGSSFAQRREEQNVADTAAMAGAYAYLNTQGGAAAKQAAAEAAARSTATANGYTNGVDNVVVDVAVSGSTITGEIRVGVSKPHRNAFVGLLGMPTWDVAVSATSQSSTMPNGAKGAMPLLFNAEAFPGAICDEDSGGCLPEVYQLPGNGNEDVPQDATQFNWTIFCTANGNPCNANSAGVEDLIEGHGTDTVVNVGDDIGPLNAGNHNTLFTALEQWLGGVFPVPIVTDDGDMVGFAYFRLLATEGNNDKVIRGYFVSPINADQLVVVNGAEDASLNTGVMTIKLID
jgi:Flp pilus assembly protein TadG